MKTTQTSRPAQLFWALATAFAFVPQAGAQPRFTALTWAPDGAMLIYSLSAQVTAGINHRLQVSTSLAPDSWTDVAGGMATGSLLTLKVTNSVVSDPPCRFFRLIAESSTTVPANMALIPAGSFEMGDAFNEGDGDERPVHSVYVSAFYMDKFEVTKALWDEVKAWSAGNGYSFDYPGSGKAANHPVQTVSWYDAVKWCNARSQKEGLVPAYYTDGILSQVYKKGQVAPYVRWDAGYRLPTEAEWERAARGGAAGHRFPWSDVDTITHSQANYYSHSSAAYDVSSTREFSPMYKAGDVPYTSPVGSFGANGYGLHDMAGNVWEWCWDLYDFNAYSNGPQSDPHGPASGSLRVIRGGSWSTGFARYCRVADRYRDGPDFGVNNGGFRSVLP